MDLTITPKLTGNSRLRGSRLQNKQDLVLLGICSLVFIWSAWRPYEYSTWLIEQVATLLVALVFWRLGKAMTFSLTSKVFMVIMFCVHTIGTHYTYSLTPYDTFIENALGFSLNEWLDWQRNHYDRFVHLCFGLLFATPIFEALQSLLVLSRNAASFLMLQIVLAVSALYELMEWCAALYFGGDLGTAYLGTQGDPWDAQADIALALVGAVAMLPFLLWWLPVRK